MTNKLKTRILITGSSGFLGSRTVNYLLRLPFISTIYGIDIRKSHTQTLSKKVILFEGNLSVNSDCSIFNDLSFEFIIHTAFDQSSDNILENNLAQMKNLIRIAKKKNVKKFIFVSSSWANINSKAPYAKSKKKCENLLINSSLSYTIIRPDTLFGLGEWKIETIKKYAKRNLGLIVGSGNYLRSPTYVYDLIKIFELTIKGTLKTGDKRKFQKIYDIGSPSPYSQNQIVKLIAKYYRKKVLILHIPKIIAKLLFTLQGKLDPALINDVENNRVSDLSNLNNDYKIDLIDFRKGLKYLDYDQFQE